MSNRGPYFVASLAGSVIVLLAIPVLFALRSPLLFFAPLVLGAVFGNGLFASWLTLRRRRGDRLAIGMSIVHGLGMVLAIASLIALTHTNVRLFN